MYEKRHGVVSFQVLLIRQQSPQEYDHPVRSSGGGGAVAIYVMIWERVLSALTKHVLAASLYDGTASSSSSTSDQEDFNVEHAQLLLFLFHSLPLMQKKQVDSFYLRRSRQVIER